MQLGLDLVDVRLRVLVVGVDAGGRGVTVQVGLELATELLASARLAITDDFRGPDGQAPFGPVAPAPAGAGPAEQLAAYLGRPV